jgi:hypothetical protein
VKAYLSAERTCDIAVESRQPTLLSA